jgi:hypothetical protein
MFFNRVSVCDTQRLELLESFVDGLMASADCGFLLSMASATKVNLAFDFGFSYVAAIGFNKLTRRDSILQRIAKDGQVVHGSTWVGTINPHYVTTTYGAPYFISQSGPFKFEGIPARPERITWLLNWHVCAIDSNEAVLVTKTVQLSVLPFDLLRRQSTVLIVRYWNEQEESLENTYHI